MSMLLSQFIPLSPPLHPCVHRSVLYICTARYSCPTYRFTSTIFLDSISVPITETINWFALTNSICCTGFGFPGSNAEYPGLILVSGRSPGGGHSNPLQYSCLEKRIPWAEEPGGLQSMRLQRVRQDWSDLTHKANISRPCIKSIPMFVFNLQIYSDVCFSPVGSVSGFTVNQIKSSLLLKLLNLSFRQNHEGLKIDLKFRACPWWACLWVPWLCRMKH